MGNFRDYNKSLMFTFREGKANSGIIEKLRELAKERNVSFNELIGSILSEYLKYLKPAKAKVKAPDYINEILDTFYEEYKLSRGVVYLLRPLSVTLFTNRPIIPRPAVKKPTTPTIKVK